MLAGVEKVTSDFLLQKLNSYEESKFKRGHGAPISAAWMLVKKQAYVCQIGFHNFRYFVKKVNSFKISDTLMV